MNSKLITYETNPILLPKEIEEVFELFKQAGILRPQMTEERLNRAIKGSNLIVCAWAWSTNEEKKELVGLARAITDLSWIGYLSHLAVSPHFQKQGIGKKLIEQLKIALGDEVTLLVHSADTATQFYQNIGFEAYSNVYKINRKK